MALTALAAIELALGMMTLGAEIAKIASAAQEGGRELTQEEQDRIMNLRRQTSGSFVAKWKKL